MPFITAENATALAERSHEIRRLQKQLQVAHIAKQGPVLVDAYSVRRLARVRRQMNSVSDALEEELALKGACDAQKIDRLASALARLNEIERQLANRPLPGSWKPERPKQVKAARAEPIALPQATTGSVPPPTPSSESPK